MALTREQQIELLKQKLLAPRPEKTSEGDFQAQTEHFTKELALLQSGQDAVDVSAYLPQAGEDVSAYLPPAEPVDVSQFLPGARPATQEQNPNQYLGGPVGYALAPLQQFALGAGGGATLGATENLLPGDVQPFTPVEKGARQVGELVGSLVPFSRLAGGVAAIASRLGILQASPRLRSAIQFGLANGVMDVLHIDQRGLSERFDPAALGLSIGGGALAGAAAVPTAKGALARGAAGKLPFYTRGELALRMGGAAFLTGRVPQLMGQPIQQSPVSPTGIPWIDDFIWDMATAAIVLPGPMKIGNKIPIIAWKGSEIIPTEATIIGTDKMRGRTSYRLRLPTGQITTYIPGSRITLDTAPPPKSTAFLNATAGGRLLVNDGDLVSIPQGKNKFAVGRFRGYAVDPETKVPFWIVDVLHHVGDTKGTSVFLDARNVDLRHLDQVKGRDWSRMNPPPNQPEPAPIGEPSVPPQGGFNVFGVPEPGPATPPATPPPAGVEPPPIIAPPLAGGVFRNLPPDKPAAAAALTPEERAQANQLRRQSGGVPPAAGSKTVSAAGTMQPGGKPLTYVPGGSAEEIAAAQGAQVRAEETIAAQIRSRAEADAAFAKAKDARKTPIDVTGTETELDILEALSPIPSDKLLKSKGTKLSAEYHSGMVLQKLRHPREPVSEVDAKSGVTYVGPSSDYIQRAKRYVNQILGSLPPDVRQQMVQRVEIVDDAASFTRAWYSPEGGIIGINLSTPFSAKQNLFNRENLGYLRIPSHDQIVATIAHEFAHRRTDIGPAEATEKAYAALGWQKVDAAWLKDADWFHPYQVMKPDGKYELQRLAGELWTRPFTSSKELPGSQFGPEEELARAVQAYVLNPELQQRNNPAAFNAVQQLFQGTPFEIRGTTTTLEGQRKLFTDAEMGKVVPTPPPVTQFTLPKANELMTKLSMEGPNRQEQVAAALKKVMEDKKLAMRWKDGADILERTRQRFGKLIDFNAAEPYLEGEMTLFVQETANTTFKGQQFAATLIKRLHDRVINLVKQQGITAPVSLEEPGVREKVETPKKSAPLGQQAPPKPSKPVSDNAVTAYYNKLRGSRPEQVAEDISKLPAKAQDFMRSLLGVGESGKQEGAPLSWLDAAKAAGYDNPGSVMRDLKIAKDGKVEPRPVKSEQPLSNDRLFFKWKQLKKMLRAAPDRTDLAKKVTDVESEMNRRGLSLELPAPPPKGEKPPLGGPKGPPAAPPFTPGNYILEPMQPTAVEFSQHLGKLRLKPLNFVLKRKTDGTVLGTYTGTQIRPDIRAQSRFDIHYAGYFGPKGERSATPKPGYHTRFLVHDLLSGTDVGYFTPSGVQRILKMDYHPGAGIDPTTGELQPAAIDIARSLQGGPRPPEARAGTTDLRREEFLNMTGPEQIAHLWSLTLENAKTAEAAWNQYASMNGMVSGYPERAADQVKLADALRQKWGLPPGLAGRRTDILEAIDEAKRWRAKHQELGLRTLADYGSPQMGGTSAAFRQSRESQAFLQILDRLVLAPDVAIDEPGNPLNAGRMPVGSQLTPAARTMLIFGHPLMADLYQKTRLSESYMHGLVDQWAVKYAAIREKLPIRDLLLIARIAEGRYQQGEKLRVADKALLQERGFVPLRGTRMAVADYQALFGNVPVTELLLPEPSPLHYVKAQQLRALLDEIQAVGKLPAERYIPNYLSHVYKRNPGGWLELPIDMNPGEEVFLRFFQKRNANAPDYDVNLDELMDMYIRGVARKTAFDPILDEFYRPEVMNSLPPAQRNYATRWLRYVVGEGDRLDNEVALALKEFGITGATGAHVRWLRRGAMNSERPATYLAHAIKGWQFIAKIGLNANLIGSNAFQAPLTIITRHGFGAYFKALKGATTEESMKRLFESTRLSEEISRDSLGQEALRVKTAMERTQELSTAGFRKVEVLNRATAFSAGTKLAHEAGYSHPEQVMAGILEVDLTQFNLGRSGRIPVLRGQAASTIFQFAPYRVEMMRLIGSMVQQTILGKDTGTKYTNFKRLVRLGVALQVAGGVNATFGPLLRFLSWEDDPELANAIHAIDAMSIDYQLGKRLTGAPFEMGYRINPIWLISGTDIARPGPALGMVQDVYGAIFGYPGSPTLASTALRNLPFGVQIERSFGEELEPYTKKVFGPKQGALRGGRTLSEKVFGPNPKPRPGDFRSRP